MGEESRGPTPSQDESRRVQFKPELEEEPTTPSLNVTTPAKGILKVKSPALSTGRSPSLSRTLPVRTSPSSVKRPTTPTQRPTTPTLTGLSVRSHSPLSSTMPLPSSSRPSTAVVSSTRASPIPSRPSSAGTMRSTTPTSSSTLRTTSPAPLRTVTSSSSLRTTSPAPLKTTTPTTGTSRLSTSTSSTTVKRPSTPGTTLLQSGTTSTRASYDSVKAAQERMLKQSHTTLRQTRPLTAPKQLVSSSVRSSVADPSVELELAAAKETIMAQAQALVTAQQEKALLQAELQELRKRNDAVEKVVRERLASAVTSWREGELKEIQESATREIHSANERASEQHRIVEDLQEQVDKWRTEAERYKLLFQSQTMMDDGDE